MTATAVVLTKQYVEQREGGYWLIDSRVSLDSIVYAFLDGTPPESIVQNFPTLALEQVYGAITFYLANQEAIDIYLKAGEVIFAELRQAARERNASLYEKLSAAKTKRQ